MAKKKRFRNKPEAIDELDGNERARLYKKARQQRRAQQAPRQRERKRSYEEWLDVDSDSVDSVQKISSATGTLDEYVGRMLDQEKAPEATNVPIEEIDSETAIGTVVQLTSQRCSVALDGQPNDSQPSDPARCEIPEWLQSASPVVIGDRVVVRSRPGADEDEVIELLERRTKLSRPDPMIPGRERAICANVDVIAIVAAVRTPPLRPRLIDRYLVAIEQGGATPIVVINKADLVPGDELEQELEPLAPLRALGVEIIICSALDNAGIEALRKRLAGVTVAFVGHSGVGKSSLVRALDPELDVETGAVTDYAGKGTHTTTASTLYTVGAEGDRAAAISIIDTPGVRSFGLQGLTRAELRLYFHEFDEFAGSCRFADCSHDHEPNCAVAAAAARNEIAPARYDTYKRLLVELPEG